MNSEKTVAYTDDELKEFRRLYYMTGSPNQLTRIEGRIDMKTFVDKVGTEKCDAMVEVVKAEDERRNSKRGAR